MNILEREIEDIIFAALNRECETGVMDHGLDVPDARDSSVHFSAVRQLKINSNGIADIVTISADWDGPTCCVFVDVIELKRGKIGYTELGQVCRYIQAVKRTVNRIGPKSRFTGDSLVPVRVRGTIIGSELDTTSDFVYLVENVDVNVYKYSLDFDRGLTFEQVFDGWFATGENLLDGELPAMLENAFESAVASVETRRYGNAATTEEPSGSSVGADGAIIEPDACGPDESA